MVFIFDTPKTVKICGKEYECDPGNPDIILGASKDFQEIIRLSHELEGLQKDATDMNAWALTEKAIQKNLELTEACRRMIEGCLGETEYLEIFFQRRPNSTEHLKLCTYLFQYLIEGRDKVVEKYLDMPEEKENAADTAAQENT